ncbi:GNAT family N-acetyltransferase [Chryseolinea sp. T2]|uniref:GNAT family N-acetyltransferase n=1 Tax=Chryseolinea sp. T2 TaxID=3129255 RepID=UPI003076BF3E
MKVEIFKIDPTDTQSFSRLLTVFAEVFGMTGFQPPPEEHLITVLQKESFFSYAATVSDVLIGGVTCYVLSPYYSASPYVYIFDLAVLPRFQRLGFGRRLVQAVIQHGRELGAEEVFVQADDIDTHALEFYRAIGGMAEKVTHFTYPLRKPPII